MSKEKPMADDDELTTVKTKKRIARKLGELAKMLGIQVQEVLDLYEKKIDSDLLRAVATRKAELERLQRE